MKVRDDSWCFACGPDNPYGLHLSDFHFQNDKFVCTFTPQRHHQGWAGLTHGGIVATLLDEVMTKMLEAQHTNAVTAQMTIRYRQPLPIGQRAVARAWVTGQRGPLVRAEAELLLPDDTLIAHAQAKLMAAAE